MSPTSPTLSLVTLDSSHLPRWLEALLGEKFFNACIIHEEAKKNEKNIFCLDCCHSICPHCLSPHRSHRLLQIRRYVYHDVIRLGDAEKLMDCAFVQSYTTNSAKVVFLNQRPQTRSCRGSGNICFTCERGLQDPYLFCSLSCKVGCRTMGCTATTEIARKKRSSVSASRPEFRPVCAPGSEISVGMMNRRKATPHRSPLY
ncbi:hypothetical protein CsSME_00012470 [Camellia sinensis var. sinensis]